MLTHEQALIMIQSLVNAVYDYSQVDPGWQHINTKKASDVRAEMYESARRLMTKLAGSGLDDADLDEIFGWEPE